MFDSAIEPKQLVIFEGAAHIDLLNHDRQKYKDDSGIPRSLFEFFPRTMIRRICESGYGRPETECLTAISF